MCCCYELHAMPQNCKTVGYCQVGTLIEAAHALEILLSVNLRMAACLAHDLTSLSSYLAAGWW